MDRLAEECDEVGRLALSSSPARLRAAFAVPLALDHRLARIAGTVREPMLAQLRLAWWRDRLNEAPGDRPRGDLVLDAATEHWRGEEAALVALVDSWERLLDEGGGANAHLDALGEGRGAVFARIAALAGHGDRAKAAAHHARVWAAASVLQRSGIKPVTAAPPPPLPRALRGAALIGGLAHRALVRGDGVLLGDRMSPLVAARLALIGR